MATAESSPVSPKSNIFPFLSGNESQRKPKTIGQLTKSFSGFSITSRHSYKPPTSKAKSNSNTRTPSITSVDSDIDDTMISTGKLTLRVINPDPQDSSDEEETNDQVITMTNTDTTTDYDVTPTNSVLDHDALVGVTSDSQFEEVSSTPIPTRNTIATFPPSPIVQSSSSSVSHPKQSIAKSTIISTKPPTPTLIRRQSKTLDEFTITKPGFLPPLDLTPFDSSHFISDSNDPKHVAINNNSSAASSGSYIKLASTVEPAPALATPINATPTSPLPSTTLDKNIPSQPRPQPSTSTHTYQNSFVSFDRNTLSSFPDDITTQNNDISNANTDRQQRTTQTSLLPNTLPTNTVSTTTTTTTKTQHHDFAYGKLTSGSQPVPPFSKYAKASYSLTNNPDALRLYRDMAKKTGDKTVQYTYAKYLLEIAALYDQGRETKHNKLSSFKHSFGEASQRLRHELNQVSKHTLDHSKHKTTPLYTNPTPAFVSGRQPMNLTMGRRSSLEQSSIHTGRGRQPSISTVHPHSPTTASISSFVTTTTNTIPYSTISSNPQHPPENNSHRRKKRALEEEGIRWMKRLAKEHMPDAAFTVATWMDECMYGFTRNPAKSFLLYDIAAKAGIREAIYKIGLYYESIDDHANALHCIKKASELGVVHATLKLAKIYLHGELSQRQNMTLAISLLHDATNDADESCPEPPYMFGLILTNTYPKAEIPRQVVEQYGGVLASLPYFEKAVHLGYPPAHSALGNILEHGLYGLGVNYAQCYIHYTEAAKREDAQGMLGLSRLNNRGSHGPTDDKDLQQKRIFSDESGWLAQREPNEESAFYWCQKAADLELSEAEFLLGWYYEIGLGTPRDLEKAQWYYHKAAMKGNEEAYQRLDQDSSQTPTNITLKKESQQCIVM